MRHVLRLVAGLLAGVAPGLAAAETCRFAGTTSHAGHVAVLTEISEAAGVVTVKVALTLAVSVWLSDVQYLTEEISTWNAGALQSLAVNTRTVVDGRIKRQQWDRFVRGAGGLEASRVQAKNPADFQRLHPGFVRHWALAGFGQPWLQDYAAARPERRPDLDLPAAAMAPGLRPPLALAFYWSRWFGPQGGVAPVFLPGFKRNARTELAFSPAVPGEGWRRWKAPLRHPGLDGAAPSMAAAWVSPEGYLLQLAIDVHAPLGSGQALIRTEGCQGIQIAPMGGAVATPG